MSAADERPFDEEPESPGALHPNQLEQIRLLTKKSQTDIAAFLGVSNRTVSAWERGTRELGADNIIKLCHFLGCTPNDLLGYDEASRLPKLDIYEESIFTFVRGMNHEGKHVIYEITGSVSRDPRFRRPPDDEEP